MAKAKAKKAPGKPTPKWWRITTDDSYTDIEANGMTVEDGVLMLHNGGSVLAAWNSWRKVERIDPPATTEAHEPDEPVAEGAEA